MNTTGFFTDATLCIGCKACEVACKEWNDVPADGYEWSGKSYDNTLGLGHSTWRHVKFVEGETEIGAGGNAPDMMTWHAIAAIGWLVAFAPWVIRIGRIYLAPRADGKPG